MKILSVEDDSLLQDSLRLALETFGYEVICAHTGKEGIELLKSSLVDLVLLDLDLPDVNGLQLLAAFKKHRHLKEVPIVVLSANLRKESVLLCNRLGAELILPKGDLHLDQLIQKLEEIAPTRKTDESCEGKLESNVKGIEKTRGIEDTGNACQPEDEAIGISQHMRDSILARIYKFMKLNPLPAHVAELVKIASSASVSREQLEEVIKRDPGLTVALMRMANSAAYCQLGRVERLQDAISQIGVREILDIAVGKKIFESLHGDAPNSLDALNLWKHGIAVGTLMDWMMKETGVGGHEDAFMLGLFHDVGKSILLLMLKDEYNELVEYAKENKRPLYEVELERLGIDHAEISEMALLQWSFQKQFAETIGKHHKQRILKSMMPPNCDLVLFLRVADTLVTAAGLGEGGNGFLEDSVVKDFIENTSLETDRLIELIKKLKDEIYDLIINFLVHNPEMMSSNPEVSYSLPETVCMISENDGFNLSEVRLCSSGAKITRFAQADVMSEDTFSKIVICPETVGWSQDVLSQLQQRVESTPGCSPSVILDSHNLEIVQKTKYEYPNVGILDSRSVKEIETMLC